MGLRGFTPATETVAIPDGGEFAVRGLSLEDISVLLRDHYEPVRVLFDRYVGEASHEAVGSAVLEQDGMGDLGAVVQDALRIAPGLLGDVIALSADEPDLSQVARKLPMGVQIDAIEKIVTLTLKAEGGLEKLTETVTRLAERMADLTVDRSS